jgi:endonuclease YncB( thermonuclease family)
MAKAIRSLPSGLQIGNALLGRHGAGRGSVAQQVHDGDTIITELDGNVSVRFLGIDTPEVSFMLPNDNRFLSITNPAWTDFLTDPFVNAPLEFTSSLGVELRNHLSARIGPTIAANHAEHARVAHRRLEELVDADMNELGQDRDTFRFFMAFAYEVMDGFGRLLCFINRDQPSANIPTPRPDSYNERLLADGVTSPYFIWPNINPFRAHGSVIDAVPTAGDITNVVNDPSLAQARQFVQQARSDGAGIFGADDVTAQPLILEPFELRFLARQSAPSRWVINLADLGTNTLLRPTNYHQIPNTEDRLFIPPQFVPLFEEQGWQRQK